MIKNLTSATLEPGTLVKHPDDARTTVIVARRMRTASGLVRVFFAFPHEGENKLTMPNYSWQKA